MVKRKIVWSQQAKIKLYEVLQFFADRNKSKVYSQRLYQKINKELNLLVKQPDIGIKTNIESVRGLIIEDYILFYEITPEKIIIHTLWDCKQNPDDLRINYLNLHPSK
jgi:plasmid stabilization system protein ParE